MNIIHIGLGMRGRHWLEIVQDRPDITSVGCADPEVSALDWARTRFPNLRHACHERLEDALRNVKADAAIIATPLALRRSYAIEALQAGLAVMLEEPFAASLADAVQVIEASRRTGRPVMVVQNDRYTRCQRTLQHLVRGGKVGTITHVSCIDRRSRPVLDNFLVQADYAQLLDRGGGHFDSLRSILDVNPVSVMARCHNAPWSAYGRGATTEALLEMEHNIHIQYYGSLTSNRDEHALWIEGDKGVLRTNRSRIWWRKRGWRFFLPIGARNNRPLGGAMKYLREGMGTLLDQLKAAVAKGWTPETSGEDHLWMLSMVEAVMLSNETGKPVRISELLSATGVTCAASAIQGQGVRS